MIDAEPLVRIDGLVKHYGKVEAVRGIDLEVGAGEIFGFLGPNGAGKSTTISILCTLIRPTAGVAQVAGIDVLKDPSAVRARIGLVFQDPSLDGQLTGRENLDFHAYLYGLPAHTRKQRIDDALSIVELTDRADSTVLTYSGGMRRRLEIARGILHYPQVLFLDEPTLGLDPQTRNKIWDYLHTVRTREHITIFMTTHYMEEAEFCDRIAIIDHGRIIALGTRDELVENAFASRSEVLARFANADDSVAAWVNQRGGLLENGIAHFTIDHATEIAGLLDAAAKAGHELADISLRKPNLESVFLQLTGRELRD